MIYFPAESSDGVSVNDANEISVFLEIGVGVGVGSSPIPLIISVGVGVFMGVMQVGILFNTSASILSTHPCFVKNATTCVTSKFIFLNVYFLFYIQPLD